MSSNQFRGPRGGRVALLVLLAAVACLPAQPAAAAPDRSKLDRHLQSVAGAKGGPAQRVLVQTVPGAGGAVADAFKKKGRRADRVGAQSDLLVTTVRTEDLAALAARTDVVQVSADAVVMPHATEQAPAPAAGHLVDTLGLGASPWDGAWVGVAVIDSGVAFSSDFRWANGFWDFTLTDEAGMPLPPDSTQTFDDYGHGTHVAGLIANHDNFAEGVYRGPAPAVTLYAMKVLDRTGAGYTSNVIRAIDFAIANRESLWIDVINLSLGHPILEPAATDPLVQAVERAVRAGIVVVVSAGNIGRNPQTGEVGYAGITSPGNAPSAITVGAVDTRQTASRLDDAVPAFSSRGPTWYDGLGKPDLVAPGAQLVSTVSSSSTLYQQTRDLLTDSTATPGDDTVYMRFSGTSMAAAVTTGVVAQMIQANRVTFGHGPWQKGSRTAPPLTPNAVKAILQFTAVDVPGADALTQGAGALNGEGAVRLAAAIDTSTPEGTSWLAVPTSPVSVIAGDALTWSQRIVWGDAYVWGDSIYSNRLAWSLSLVWGDALVWGDSLVRGESLVWGESLIWGESLVWGESFVWGDSLIWGEHLVWQEP